MLHSSQITGAVYSSSQIVKMPEFRAGGFWPILQENWWDYIIVDILMLDQGITGILWIFLLVMTFCVGVGDSRQKVRRPEVVFIPISALVNYIIANIVLLHLYEPSRYLVFPSQALTLCCFPFIFEAIFNWAAPRFIGGGALGILNKRVLGSSIAAIAIVGLLVFSARLFFNRGGTDPMPAEVYSFLGALPKDTLIAATPVDGDRVPMRSRRSVFILVNSLYPHHSGYYEETKQRCFALLAAMYDSGPNSLRVLRSEIWNKVFCLEQEFYQWQLLIVVPAIQGLSSRVPVQNTAADSPIFSDSGTMRPCSKKEITRCWTSIGWTRRLDEGGSFRGFGDAAPNCAQFDRRQRASWPHPCPLTRSICAPQPRNLNSRRSKPRSR